MGKNWIKTQCVAKKPLNKNTVILYENTVILDKNTVFGLDLLFLKDPPLKNFRPLFFYEVKLWKSQQIKC